MASIEFARPFRASLFFLSAVSLGIFGLILNAGVSKSADGKEKLRWEYQVEIKGGHPGVELEQILREAKRAKLLPNKTLVLDDKQRAQSLCSVLNSELSLRSDACTTSLIGVIRSMNPSLGSRKSSRLPESIVVPDIELKDLEFFRSLNPSDAKEKKLCKRLLKGVWGETIMMANCDVKEGLAVGVVGMRVEWEIDGNESTCDQLKKLNSRNVSVFCGMSARSKLGLDKASSKLKKIGKELGSWKPLPWSMTPMDRFRKSCQVSTAEFNYMDLMPITKAALMSADCVQTACVGNKCNSLSIFDWNLEVSNPDIKRNIASKNLCSVNTAEYVDRADQRFDIKTCSEREDLSVEQVHGTHLAGILASAHNGSGFSGLEPSICLGFSSLAEMSDASGFIKQSVFTDNFQALINRVARDQFSEQQNMTLLTTRFWPYESGTVAGFPSELVNDDARFAEMAPNKQIKDYDGILYVIAAGQFKDGGIRIHDRLAMAPQNIGDLKNVIQVAACQDCLEPKEAKLWPLSNFSLRKDRLVHVAAPGGDMIPGLAGNKGSMALQGTSQSAAFVGGLAAKMLSCHPDAYRRNLHAVKDWMILTSHVFENKEDKDKLAGGVIDAGVSMLSPATDWIFKRHSPKYEKMQFSGWCKENIRFTTTSGKRRIATDGIRRILRSSKNENEFFLYLASSRGVGEDLEVNDIVGPGKFESGEKIPEVAITGNSGEGIEVVKVNELDDLILRDNYDTHDCSAEG